MRYCSSFRRRERGAAVFLLCLILGASTSAGQQSATPSSASSTKDIPITVAGPMSGDLAKFGAQMRQAAELAVADINAAGGVLGKPLRLVIQDDGCDPARARSVAQKIAAQDVVAVIGHFCSSVSIPASAIYAGNGILQITPASSNPMLTEQAAAQGWHTVFRTCARDDYQGVVAADYLATHFGHSRIAVLRDDSVYSATIGKPLLKGLFRYGIEPVYQGRIVAGRSSYQDTVDALIEARPDIIYFSGYHPEAALLVKETRAGGFRPIFFGSDALMTLDFVEQAGPLAEGVMFTGNLEPGWIPAAAGLIRRLQGQGFEATSTSVATYAAIQEFVLAVERAGTTDAEAVAAALRSDSFETVIGIVTFDAKGDLRQQAYAVYYFRGGKFQLMR